MHKQNIKKYEENSSKLLICTFCLDFTNEQRSRQSKF